MQKLLLIILLLVMPVAAEAADPGCTTTNLFTDLAQNAPEDYQAIRAEADAVPNGRGIFWQVTHPNLAHTSYLFGTLHKADPRVVDLPDSVIAAFDASDTLAVELTNPRGQLTATISAVTNPGLFLPANGQRLSQRIAPDTVAPLRDFLFERGINLADVDRFRPWVAIGFLALSTCDLEFSDSPVLDEVLIERAKVANKNLVGLETIRDQLKTLSEVDEQIYISSIEELARAHAQGLPEDMMRTTIQLYLDEDISMIGPMSVYFSEPFSLDEDTAQNYAEFEQHLLDSRNYSLALKSALQIAKGPTFVAVGAAHLYGETGLVADLRARGFTVTRIPLER